MLSGIILFSYFSLVFCFDTHKYFSDMFNASTNYTNLTEISEKIESFEKDLIRLLEVAAKRDQMICDRIEANIKSMEELRKNYTLEMENIDKGKINFSDSKKFLEIRGDIIFGRRNVEIAIERLNKSKVHCFNESSQMERYYSEERKKNKKSKESILKTINQIIQINDEL